nr:endoglucanase 2-like [Ipomoea batatas]
MVKMEDKKSSEENKEEQCCRFHEKWAWRLLVLLITVLVIAASSFTLRRYFHRRNSKPSVAIVADYASALGVAMQFFDVQKSGELVDNEIGWRGDSGLDDGREVNLDLSKGMYDAGDSIKFGFPMAFTATILSWAVLEYGEHMKMAKEINHAIDSLKWITDFLINAHPSPNVLFVQVGNAVLDHKCWERPEATPQNRPLTQINMSYPGTEVAAETAAAMAAASLVFRETDAEYSSLLLKHAKELFVFADTYRGSYSVSIPQVQEFYNSTGYGDELLWAAAWLYHATADQSFLTYLTVYGTTFANWGNPSWFSWDNKLPGTQVLLSRVNLLGSKPQDLPLDINLSLQKYRQTAEAVICNLLPESPTATPDRTDEGGLIWFIQWNPIQYAVASAFLAVVYSDYMVGSGTPEIYCSGELFQPMDIRNFAISQVDYVLGKNPMKMSYLVGYGDKYPRYVHHRGASIPADANPGCSDGFKWLNSTAPNPNVAVGALVGGPFRNDTFLDSRNDTMQSEPTTYNSALVVGLLSGLLGSSTVVESFR